MVKWVNSTVHTYVGLQNVTSGQPIFYLKLKQTDRDISGLIFILVSLKSI